MSVITSGDLSTSARKELKVELSHCELVLGIPDSCVARETKYRFTLMCVYVCMAVHAGCGSQSVILGAILQMPPTVPFLKKQYFSLVMRLPSR